MFIKKLMILIFICFKYQLIFAQVIDFDIISQEITFDLRTSVPKRLLNVEIEVLTSGNQFIFPLPANQLEKIKYENQDITWQPFPPAPQRFAVIMLPKVLQVNEKFHLNYLFESRFKCEPNPRGIYNCIDKPNFLMLPFAVNAINPWYLTNFNYLDDFKGSLTVYAEKNLIVTSEDQVKVTPIEGGDFKKWEFIFTHPKRALSLFVGDLQKYSLDDSSLKIFAHQTDLDDSNKLSKIKQIYINSEKIISYYEKNLFKLKAFEIGQITFIPEKMSFGGLGMLGNIFTSSEMLGINYNILEQTIAHEFAHSWWGGIASSSQVPEANWLQEGFAEYSTWRALGHLYNENFENSGMRMNALWYMFNRGIDLDLAISNPDTYYSPISTFVNYHKGAVVLKTLEKTIGRSNMDLILNKFLSRGSNQLSLNNLLQDVKSISNLDASDWAKTWIHQDSFPVIFVERVHTFKSNELILKTKTTPWRENGFENGFKWNAPLRILFKNGSSEEILLPLSLGNQEHQIQFQEEIDEVSLDPDWTAVRLVKHINKTDINLDGITNQEDVSKAEAFIGGFLPRSRRVDGRYEPIMDIDGNGKIDQNDIQLISDAIIENQ